MNKDPFGEYLRETSPAQRERVYIWRTAIGLQAVDGLETSDYLREIASRSIQGELTPRKARELIETYYKTNRKQESPQTEEADKVGARIADILSEQGFTLSPAHYLAVHRRLFEGIYPHAGQIRDYNFTKKEWVLNGDTVTYSGWRDLRETLAYDISEEKVFSYEGLSMHAVIHHLALFITRLWQLHVFGEGNTRTTAVFLIQYLKALGFDVTNDIFAENAWYFRNAMVRANYTHIGKGVQKTTEYMERFLHNLLLNEKHPLRNRELHIDFKNRKQDIEVLKQDIETKKQDIDCFAEKLPKKSASNAALLYRTFGFERIFSRQDVMSLLSITASPASELLRKMVQAGMVTAIKGMGKGKYRFHPSFFDTNEQ